MKNRRLLTLALIGAATMVLAGFAGNGVLRPLDGLDPRDPRVTLKHVEAEIDRRWGVQPILSADLAQRLAESGAVLFDVREAEEYEKGHLPGAIRVDPDTSAEAFYRTHGDRMAGKPVVLYCSVGVRSSLLAKRLASHPAPATGTVLNLRGGVFRWVADGRSLVAGSAPGQLHPYDSGWEKLYARTVATE